MYNALYILRYLSKEDSTSRGFGVDGPEEAYQILRNFLLQLQINHSMSLQNEQNCYFFAVLDLEKCFDSVDTTRLYDIVSSLVESDPNTQLETSQDCQENLSIQRYQVTHYIPSAERFITRAIRKVSSEDEIHSFHGCPFHESFMNIP